ncbi:ribosome biogenesis protein Nop16 [Annulohypoxylon maeteangense]|uniref:ribosome biogenesis protein Nop16 n=1 Tax=Annulohypoxylon maeteangense TaxID=1927788 RepID=UPI002008D2EA|nr:ribosome biogenesis protein Nop16 [Annulohypoxylon maeteangense]KAI0885166.1 ribosome biogenesis protein Nop16 [Annulohypoxylon maeteangense]
MGRDLQKRKRRSSRNAIRQPSSNKSKRLLNPLGNDTVARNWNKKETASQNYRRLGLVSRLKAPAGGVEPSARVKSAKPADPFAITSQPAGAVIGEVRVERDENGRIVRVLHGSGPKENPLNDPLNDLDSDDDMEDEEAAEEWEGIDEVEDGTGIFPELETQANRPVAKKVKTLSKREAEWLQRLVEKYGDDTKAMARDRKLNPRQQTEADIARRIKKLKSPSA